MTSRAERIRKMDKQPEQPPFVEVLFVTDPDRRHLVRRWNAPSGIDKDYAQTLCGDYGACVRASAAVGDPTWAARLLPSHVRDTWQLPVHPSCWESGVSFLQDRVSALEEEHTDHLAALAKFKDNNLAMVRELSLAVYGPDHPDPSDPRTWPDNLDRIRQLRAAEANRRLDAGDE